MNLHADVNYRDSDNRFMVDILDDHGAWVGAIDVTLLRRREELAVNATLGSTAAYVISIWLDGAKYKIPTTLEGEKQ